MYQLESFREDDLDAQIALVRANPLGLIVSQGPQGLVADPIPFLIDTDEQGQATLRAHLSRGNPHWSLLQAGQECLVVFQGLRAISRRDGMKPSGTLAKWCRPGIMPPYTCGDANGHAR